MVKILAICDVVKPDYYNLIRDYFNTHYGRYGHITVKSIADTIEVTGYDAVVFWMQDPLDDRAATWKRATELEKFCLNEKIPVIQRPSCLPNGRKATARTFMHAARLHTPDMHVIQDVSTFFYLVERNQVRLPIFVRENGHHGHGMYLIRQKEDLDESVRYGIRYMGQPLAVEFIDTKRPELDRYVKYRCVVTDDICTPLHVQTSRKWITRGDDRINDDVELTLEKEYVKRQMPPDLPRKFVAAAAGMGFDFCAFDYGVVDGEVVVWEVNAHPFLHFVRGKTENDLVRNAATDGVMREICMMYLEKANKKA